MTEQSGKELAAWEIEATDAQAAALLKEGIGWMQSGNIEAALISFDRARELRARLPNHIPVHAYALAACWLNRAEALERLDSMHQPLALYAYDEALKLLRPLPLGTDMRFPKRFAVALQNRALLLAAQQPAATPESIVMLNEAIAVLDQAHAMNAAERDYLLAVVWTNLANVQVAGDTPASDAAAQQSAQRALGLARPYEHHFVSAAETGLKARHILCQVAARHLALPAEGERPPLEAMDTSDLVDEGLELAREWKRRGVDRFQPVAEDLFRFGARVYARYQPHFLEEFLGEQLS